LDGSDQVPYFTDRFFALADQQFRCAFIVPAQSSKLQL
jgi:hypothetical protein